MKVPEWMVSCTGSLLKYRSKAWPFATLKEHLRSSASRAPQYVAVLAGLLVTQKVAGRSHACLVADTVFNCYWQSTREWYDWRFGHDLTWIAERSQITLALHRSLYCDIQGHCGYDSPECNMQKILTEVVVSSDTGHIENSGPQSQSFWAMVDVTSRHTEWLCRGDLSD